MSTEPTALALIEKPPTRLVKPSKRDKDLWLMKKRGWTEAQLATKFNMKEPQVKLAIDRQQLFMDSFNNEMVDLEFNQMFTRILQKEEKVLTDAMKAERTETYSRGKSIIRKKVADHPTRLKAVQVATEMRAAMMPKGVGVQVNTQINNPGGQQPPRAQGFDFEARLRQIRAEEGLANDDQTVDAEYEEVAASTAAEELADIGIELDEDDED